MKLLLSLAVENGLSFSVRGLPSEDPAQQPSAEDSDERGRVLHVLVEKRFALPDQSQVERELGYVDADEENKIHIFVMTEK